MTLFNAFNCKLGTKPQRRLHLVN